jgi:hypothetical protein
VFNASIHHLTGFDGALKDIVIRTFLIMRFFFKNINIIWEEEFLPGKLWQALQAQTAFHGESV